MDNTQRYIWDILCSLSGEEVAKLFTGYHGLQLINVGFYNYLVEEGYIEEQDEDESDNEDED